MSASEVRSLFCKNAIALLIFIEISIYSITNSVERRVCCRAAQRTALIINI
ncbi:MULTISPECIES: hypothetical protein [unclassified Calothrix]|uniref:hypothetical protein n=1 Tax=unclassified Calothrix TaxID=2619626 RepID=UPI0016895A4D|nr:MULTISPECIES: hypothetical protein [unclassified Calothrix]